MTDFLSNLIQRDSDVVINQDYPSQEKITPTEVTQYKLLQYDLLFGKDFASQLDPRHQLPANDGYIQGDGPVKITKCVFSDGLLTIQGGNFTANAKVYIDGKVMESTFVSSNELSASLPQESALDIQLKLTDSMNKIIMESNVYQLPQS